MKKILVLNSGSSSLKYQLFNVDGDKYEVVAKGLAERIGIDGSCVSIKFNGEKKVKEISLPSHTEAINEVFNLLLDGALKSMDELTAVGHRVVHGGEAFAQSVLITPEVVAKVEEELEEVNEAIAEGDDDHLEQELGDLLFSVVNLCRFMKIRPNVAMHRCNEKVKARFQRLFDTASERGIPVDKDHVDEMNELWEEVKKTE